MDNLARSELQVQIFVFLCFSCVSSLCYSVSGLRGRRDEAGMLCGKRIAVVMPAYNAAKTLEKTVSELRDLVDIRILVDDKSTDETVDVARKLGLRTFAHAENYGYGRNQQTRVAAPYLSKASWVAQPFGASASRKGWVALTILSLSAIHSALGT